MPIDLSYDYIAAFQKLEDILPYKQYNSGAKVEHNSVYSNKIENTNPVLCLEYDILNYDGFGIKRGFYEIRPNSEYTFLMFIQAGKIKAKIPVVSHSLISEYGSDYEWGDKKKKKNSKNDTPVRLMNSNDIVSPQRIVPKLTDKQKKKREKQFKKGIDPIEYIHSDVRIEYDEKTSNYIIIWEKYNTRVIGVLKLK